MKHGTKCVGLSMRSPHSPVAAQHKISHHSQGCHSDKVSKFPDLSLTCLHFPLTNQTYQNEDMYILV